MLKNFIITQKLRFIQQYKARGGAEQHFEFLLKKKKSYDLLQYYKTQGKKTLLQLNYTQEGAGTGSAQSNNKSFSSC